MLVELKAKKRMKDVGAEKIWLEVKKWKKQPPSKMSKYDYKEWTGKFNELLPMMQNVFKQLLHNNESICNFRSEKYWHDVISSIKHKDLSKFIA